MGPQQRLGRLAGLVPKGSTTAARTPFVLLVVLLLGSGMLGLLFLNASLNEGSFELSELRRETQELTDQQQELQAEVDGYSAPDALAERARELGMVPGGPPAFLAPDGSLLGETDPTPAPEPTSDAEGATARSAPAGNPDDEDDARNAEAAPAAHEADRPSSGRGAMPSGPPADPASRAAHRTPTERGTAESNGSERP
ncbi:FtsB family cell division protein [Streptomyces mayteni]